MFYKNVFLTKIVKKKNRVEKVESDHHPIITKLKLNWDKNDNKSRVEIYNLKNEACQAAFKRATSAEYNNHNLSAIIDTKDDLNIVTNKLHHNQNLLCIES